MYSYKDVIGMKVEEVMVKGVITVSPNEHILKAATTMTRHKFRRIPVAEEGRLVGMLSWVMYTRRFSRPIYTTVCANSPVFLFAKLPRRPVLISAGGGYFSAEM